MNRYSTKSQDDDIVVMADYITKMIDASGKSQREIAKELGFKNPNIISMWKKGDVDGGTKIPLDRIPDIARVLHLDASHLFRLALAQYWPNRASAVKAIFGHTCSKNEAKILEAYRIATDNTDPPVSDNQQVSCEDAFRSIFTPAN